MVSKTIYTKDSKGRIRFLLVESIKNSVIQTSGVVGTDRPIKRIKGVSGKNIGKSNETTPEDQAIEEAKAIIAKKLSADYFETIQEAED